MPGAHDYRLLIQRWRAVAKANGLQLKRLAFAGPFALHYLKTPALPREGGMYISAGIHGDEPGGPEALITWAERHGTALRNLPLFILPCFNPWGLTNNSRFDVAGRDLNRSFHRNDIPELEAWRRLIEPYRFEAAVLLHEDYDGEGFYLYEIEHRKPGRGEALRGAAARKIAIDRRERIDIFKAQDGIIRRRLRMKRFEVQGYPEAIWLHMRHSVRTFTVETPSEFALPQRVEAHVAVIAETLRLTLELRQ